MQGDFDCISAHSEHFTDLPGSQVGPVSQGNELAVPLIEIGHGFRECQALGR